MPALTTGASVEKIGEAAACAVKRLHLDYRMVQVGSDLPLIPTCPTARHPAWEAVIYTAHVTMD